MKDIRTTSIKRLIIRNKGIHASSFKKKIETDARKDDYKKYFSRNCRQDTPVTKELDLIHSNLFYIMARLSADDYSDANIGRLDEEIRCLEKLLLDTSYPANEKNMMLQHMEKKDMLTRFQEAYGIYADVLEKSFSAMLTSGKVENDDISKYLLYERFASLIKDEIRLGAIKKDDKLAFIGPGHFPISALLYRKLTGCHIDCYDKNASAVMTSREVVSQQGLEKDIKIYSEEIQKIKDPYDIIVVAALTQPKNKILNSRCHQQKEGSRIICRTSDSIRQAFYKPADEALLANYKIADKSYAKAGQTISSVLLK